MADLRDFTKKNPVFTGTDGIRLPTGNNAQRTASSNVAGTMRFNLDIDGIETYTSTGWQPLAAPPTINSVTPSTFNGESGTEFTITGSNFTPDVQVYFVTANNTALLASTVSYYSSVQVRATTPRNITVQEEPLSVRVVQQSGTTTKLNCVDAGGNPTWITTAGTLGSIFGANTVNVYVSATDPEGTSVTYQISSGSLPGGLQLSANGLVQGLANSVLANTTYNFVIKANDTVNNNTDRSFSYTILNRAPLINTAAGLIATIYSGNAVPNTTISAYDPDGGQLVFTSPSGNIVNTTIGSANGIISGTPIIVTTNTTYTIDVTVTDEGSLTASNTYTFTVLNRPPVWNTAATLPSTNDNYVSGAITVNAYDPDGGSVTYTLSSGTLPSGLSLVSSNGAFIGTVQEVESNTVSTFTINATDIGNDSNSRTFNITITPADPDPNFANTVLLLRGDAGNTVIKDASANNLPMTIYGDARASNFSPYNTSWGVYFDGSSRIRVPAGTNFAYGTGAFTLECWVYPVAYTSTSGYGMGIYTQTVSGSNYFLLDMSSTSWGWGGGHGSYTATNRVLPLNAWTHLAVVREGTGTNQTKLYENGVLVATTTNTTDLNDLSMNPTIGGYTHSNILDFRGYVSNLRIVKGSALYTSNFTPSTIPLTPVSGTSWLACQSNSFSDKSNNNFTVTVTAGTPKIVGWSPFAETDTTTGSIYYDGSGDYVLVNDRSEWNLGSSNWNAECWIYPTASSISAPMFDKRSVNTNYSEFPQLSLESNVLKLYVAAPGGSSWLVSLTGPTIVPYQWTHLSASRNGTTYNLLVNGNIVATGTGSGAQYSGSSSLCLGVSSSSGQNPFTGYISDARIVVGNALYTANTNPPSSQLSNVANTKLLTFQSRKPHNNKTFQDSSNNKFLLTAYSNITQGAFSPFVVDPGKWSYYLDGTGDYLLTNAKTPIDWMISSGNSGTIEAWIYPTSYKSHVNAYHMPTILGLGDTYFSYGVTSTGLLRFYWWTGSANTLDSSTTVPLNKWTHVALVVNGTGSNNIKLYINGQNVGTSTFTNISWGSGSGGNNLYVGRTEFGSTSDWIGYISNLRISNNAVYTANFTPSSTSLTTTSNTTLLTAQTNRFQDVTNTYTFTPNGNILVNAFSPFAPNTSYKLANNGGSIYCSGSDDYLYNTDPIFNPNKSFTAEGWFYLTGTPGATGYWIIGQNNNAQFIWVINSSLAVSWASFNYPSAGSSYNASTASNAIRINCWNHLAVVRNGNNFNIYVNGTSANSVTGLAAEFGYPTNNSLFTNNQIGDYGSFIGYISDLRFDQGVVYTGNFTPPTAPLKPTPNTRLLLKGTEGALIDLTGKNNFESVGDVKANNSIYKFANSSASFDGSGDYLTTVYASANHHFNMGTGDYTVEFWFNGGTPASQQCFFDFRNADTTGQGIALNYTTSRTVFLYMTATRITSSALAANTWHHVAAVRYNGVYTLYINGVSAGTWSNSDAVAPPANRPIIGAVSDGSQGFTGQMQDVRISRFARYTSNFTVPTKTFMNR